MSMGELARRAGVTQPTVANWELREQDGRITLATLQRAADALGADLSYALELRRKPARKSKKAKPAPRPQRRAAVTRTAAPRRADPNDIWL